MMSGVRGLRKNSLVAISRLTPFAEFVAGDLSASSEA
jgi:hypothetical protein